MRGVRRGAVTSREREAMAAMRREVRDTRQMLVELARVVHTHVRTDLPPDACLPRMTRLRARIERKK
jgi:hypothetical protein